MLVSCLSLRSTTTLLSTLKMLTPLLLAFAVLTQSSFTAATSSVTWLQPQRSAIVKLSTPGYPSKEGAGQHAIILKFELSADNKTLLLDGTPFLPLQNYYIPPRISAYHVPDDIKKDAIIAIAESRTAGKESIRGQRLELDYDRLVEGDPTGGPPYYNHKPTLRFRLMGLGSDGADTLLDPQKQDIVQVSMRDQNEGGWSNDAASSYTIDDIELLPAEKVYAELSTSLGDHMGPEADQEKECTRKNWKCPDEGVYEAGSPYRTPYRFIWRKRYDQYGRIGSLRHAFVEQWEISKQKVYNDPRNSALVALGVLLATVLAIVSGLKSRAQRAAAAKEPTKKHWTEKEAEKAARKADKAAQKAEAKEGEKHEQVEDEEEEEEDSEDEDAAWMSEMAAQSGEVQMTVDETSNLIDLMSDEEGDLDAAAAIPADKALSIEPKKKKKNSNKRVAFKAETEE
ncbi:uncharacterized protein N0V89_008903 [Didymosphaeria variabile]|uniref:Uncharacterized protein n=1 Tax=Didymosphaeria variabile TaxID=1932322 RepID=A0A9W8XIG4_9PLEO|nr:uncharacterized protein N0V89_008903 [Didymosphaeria variabile]KAJ4350282.1 hypothetical protein N0V89_008903 [Didymosphaeria variabile]